MDSLLSAPNEQRHTDNDAPLVPGPTAVTARLDGPMHDFDGWFAAATMAPQAIDATAEETCPPPSIESASVEMPIESEAQQPTPDIPPPQVPSAAASKLMDQLDELASDLAAKGHSSREGAVETIPQTSKASAEPQAVEPSIQVPSRSDFGHSPFAAGSQPMRRRMVITSAGVCLAALLGAVIAWQSDFGAPSKSANDSDLAATKQAVPAAAQASPPKTATAQPAPAQPAPMTQAAATAPSPDLAKQLDTMAQDLAAVRRSVEQLTAKQEELAAAQQQLDQLAAKQTQLFAKQEQLAQNIAKLQATEQSVKPRPTPPTQSRAAAIPPPSRTIQEPPPQVAPVQRAPSHPVPPLPIPQ